MTCIGQYEETFCVLAPNKISGPKTIYFLRLRNLMPNWRANISAAEHDRDNWKTALETTKGPLHRPEIDERWSTSGEK